MGFIGTWMFYAVLYWIVCLLHGDHLHIDDEDYQKCMTNVYDFTTAFLFSLETQHTIGYGFRAMEPKCPEAIILLMLQSASGVFIQSLMTGVIFAKLARGKTRRKTIMFSQKAVISKRDDVYCLLFRCGDMRPKSNVISASIRAILVKSHVTEEGEILPLRQFPLELQTEASGWDNYAFMVWPTTIIHKIDEKSPLWDLSEKELASEIFEIVVILEGTVGSSGASIQIRTSYLSTTEIIWGHKLAPLITFQKGAQYTIDYSQFHQTIQVAMPRYSAKEHAEKTTTARRTQKAAMQHPRTSLKSRLDAHHPFMVAPSKREQAARSFKERILAGRRRSEEDSTSVGDSESLRALNRRGSLPIMKNSQLGAPYSLSAL